MLIDRFLHKFSGHDKRKSFSPQAVECLTAYNWPGNVRELANVVERTVIISGPREKMTVSDLPDRMLRQALAARDFGDRSSGVKVLTLMDAEVRYIQRILRLVGGNKTEAARPLDISCKSLYDKLHTNENRYEV